MVVKFSDGVDIEVSGELRKFRCRDGMYVVGEGSLVPVDSDLEADELIDLWRKTR